MQAIFGAVAEQWDEWLEDYGQTPGAADLFTYTIEVTHGGRTKQVTGDDMSLPPDLRALIDMILQAIDSARGR